MIDVSAPPSPFESYALDNEGGTDIKTNLQYMINQNAGAFYFPPGIYKLGSTLVLNYRTGNHFTGCGMGQKNDAGPRSAIFWAGNATDPMIEYRGSGLIWDGLSLWGKQAPPQGTGTRAKYGIKIVQPSSGPITTGKIWAPSIMIDDCVTGIYADGGTLSADSCAFGYAWIRWCDTGFHLDGANATMFTFGYVHPLSTLTVFKVTGGGRVYVHSINVVTREVSPFGTILDVAGGDIPNGFFHINGLTGDGNIFDYHLLRNVDTGNGLTHVRFTNAHLTSTAGHFAKIDINRSDSTSGQTVVEITGSRGLTAMAPTTGPPSTPPRVKINGASSSKLSRIIVRDSELPRATEIVDAANSSHYTDNRIKNWRFGAGLESDIERP